MDNIIEKLIEKINNKQWLTIAIGLVVVISIGISAFLINTAETPQQQKIIETTVLQSDTPSSVYVDVKGEVVTPGVYHLPVGSRVKDVIELAGGLKDSADKTRLNLAQIVTDEMVIMVYANGQADVVVGKEIGKINLNTATKEQIMTLKGIGESKAAAIINYRQTKGVFKKLEDLKNIKGFSDKMIETLKSEVSVP